MKDNRILCLEWESKGRDIHLVEPVLSYLELVMGYNVIRRSIFESIFHLIFNKPLLVILPSSSGAHENFKISKLCYFLGINCISFTSEGDFVKDRLEYFFWGCSITVMHLLCKQPIVGSNPTFSTI